MSSVEESKERTRNLNELTDHLIKLIESDDKRFSFEFCVGGTMEIYDKEKEIGYAVHIAPIEYDENGNAINLQQTQSKISWYEWRRLYGKTKRERLHY